jgi:hypothetical protein
MPDRRIPSLRKETNAFQPVSHLVVINRRSLVAREMPD